MTPTPAREGLPELPEYFQRDLSHMRLAELNIEAAIHARACYDAGYHAAYIASQPTQGKHVGWFMTANAAGDLAFLEHLMDPREIHDNGKPYYRAYAALPHPQPEKGSKKEPCGECHLDGLSGCDICGWVRPTTPPPPSDAAQGDDYKAGMAFILRNRQAILKMCHGVNEAFVVERTFDILAAHKGEGNGR